MRAPTLPLFKCQFNGVDVRAITQTRLQTLYESGDNCTGSATGVPTMRSGRRALLGLYAEDERPIEPIQLD